MKKYKRVLIKLSGEALQDKENCSILDAKKLNEVALAIKDIADNGGAVKENISKEEAEEIKAKLEEAGASVEIA